MFKWNFKIRFVNIFGIDQITVTLEHGTLKCLIENSIVEQYGYLYCAAGL